MSFCSGRNVDKFEGQEVLRSDNGLVFLPKCVSFFMSLKVESYVRETLIKASPRSGGARKHCKSSNASRTLSR